MKNVSPNKPSARPFHGPDQSAKIVSRGFTHLTRFAHIRSDEKLPQPWDLNTSHSRENTLSSANACAPRQPCRIVLHFQPQPSPRAGFRDERPDGLRSKPDLKGNTLTDATKAYANLCSANGKVLLQKSRATRRLMGFLWRTEDQPNFSFN